MMLCSDEIFWGKMPLLVMKFVGAKYGNKNVKIILVEKMMLCNDEIFGGKSWQATYPQSPSLLVYIYTYVYIYIYMILILFAYTYIPFVSTFGADRRQVFAQDVYIAALEPLEMPSDARSFVIQVLTTSGPAPDALVVPVVDESYDVPWLVGGVMSWGSFEDEFLKSKWIHVPWCFAHLQGSAV